jgi:hypothetical protein
MATKADTYRAEVQREAQASKPKRRRSRGPVAERDRPKERYPNPTSHNEAPRAAKNSVYELEPGQTKRPSRKSTRRSPTHVKTDSALRITAVTRNTSPKARAGQRPARRK